MHPWLARSVFGALLAVLVAAGWPAAAGAQSLWPGSGSLYSDSKAHQVGDLVTLIIVERTEATQSATTETGKDSSLTLGPVAISDWVPAISPISASASDSFRGGGSTTRGGTLNARMTAKVVDVLPNGILVIEGRQTIVVNGDEQVIVVSGLVRPQDIQPDNTVLSTFVADATISYYGQGPLADKQQPGLLTRLLNWLF
ncbi:MAG: flagellar basal body L-ring protein FlgH [Firmicutes bacterium]|nr:flagellar basal body L-ring protein FlgH [Bacillota bacterium]